MSSNKIKSHIPGDNIYDFYRNGKNTLVVDIKRPGKFQSCKPSANYQLTLISGCTGQCQYCYLNTNLGDKPYVKVNVNIDDILNTAQKYMDERLPQLTIFEGSATSDPVPITFEVISHRYTTRAKNVINEVFPDNTLPMNDDERKYKYGQFGYGKYVYTKEQLAEMKTFFTDNINSIFENKIIKYII